MHFAETGSRAKHRRTPVGIAAPEGSYAASRSAMWSGLCRDCSTPAGRSPPFSSWDENTYKKVNSSHTTDRCRGRDGRCRAQMGTRSSTGSYQIAWSRLNKRRCLMVWWLMRGHVASWRGARGSHGSHELTRASAPLGENLERRRKRHIDWMHSFPWQDVQCSAIGVGTEGTSTVYDPSSSSSMISAGTNASSISTRAGVNVGSSACPAIRPARPRNSV